MIAFGGGAYLSVSDIVFWKLLLLWGVSQRS